ncbi:hypothetical protein DENSPDRAFT_933797, partial [Dentipellis sp. KUC8613]
MVRPPATPPCWKPSTSSSTASLRPPAKTFKPFRFDCGGTFEAVQEVFRCHGLHTPFVLLHSVVYSLCVAGCFPDFCRIASVSCLLSPVGKIEPSAFAHSGAVC